MRLRLIHTRWCIAFIVVIVINVHVSLWVHRMHKNPSSRNLHPLRTVIPLVTDSNSGKLNVGNDSQSEIITEKLLTESAYTLLDSTPLIDLNEIDTLEKSAPSALSDQLSSTAPETISGVVTKAIGGVTRRKDMSTDYDAPKTAMPFFATDGSEFIFSSMIERSSLSADLYLTTFMLCHHALGSSSTILKINKVHPIMKATWRLAIRKFQTTRYHPSGARIQEADDEIFHCKIHHSPDSVPYTVTGIFMPNRLTADPAANRLLDILRCPLMESQAAYRSFANSNGSIYTEIIRGNTTIASFTVPWKSRQTGFLLSRSIAATAVDTWRGHELTMDGRSSVVQAIDKLHICIPFSSQEPTRSTLPMYLEFVSHHLLLGASHINLPLPFGWNSKAMKRFTNIFQSYIDEGKLTLTSLIGDGIDQVFSISGISLPHHALKIMQINSCLYHSRGMAEYLLVVELHEFFVPKGNNWNFLDVLKSIEATEVVSDGAEKDSQTGGISITKEAKNSHGWAIEHNHPACYITVFSDVVLNPFIGGYTDTERPWTGQRFSHDREPSDKQGVRAHSHKRAILPIDRIFQSSFDTGGSCRLPSKWTTCGASGVENLTDTGSFCRNDTLHPSRFNFAKFSQRVTHDFDEVVTDADSHYLDRESGGSILHYLPHHTNYGASPKSLLNTSIYTVRYFEPVMDDLHNRGLLLIMTMQEKNEVQPYAVEDKWKSLFSEEDPLESLFPTIMDVQESSYNFSLPNNFSTRPHEYEVDLPNFAVDYSDYAMGAMIERVSDSYDLYTTVFFLCHTLLEPKDDLSSRSVEKVSAEVYDVWKKAMNHFEATKYARNGVRVVPPAFYCNISHTADGPYYLVEGIFVPNKLTPDSNANKRSDILRCKMEDTEKAYMDLAGSSHELRVEILRGNFSMMRFRIPWGIRKTGYMLSEPADQVVTRFDPWKGFNRSTPGEWTSDRIHMCVPGWEDEPSKATLPHFFEWIQHHILLGVDHIFSAVTFSWESKHMHTMRKALGSFIDDGLVSITSHSGDGIDGVYSSGGLRWERDNIKNFHVNMCLYYSKGTADYVGVWDYDEFFQPRGSNKNLIDVVKAMESPSGPIAYFHPSDADPLAMYHAGWKPQRGMADGSAHPFCYLQLHSEVTYCRKKVMGDPKMVLMEKPWIGQLFSHGHEAFGHGMGFKKSIRPTRTIFQGGLHMAGACRLPPEWNGCANKTDFCFVGGGPNSRLTSDSNGDNINFQLNHHFDEVVMDGDAKLIDPKVEGVLNHVQYRRWYKSASKAALAKKGEYTESHFGRTYEALERRGLVMLIELPEEDSPPLRLPDSTWFEHAALDSKIESAISTSAVGVVWLDPLDMNSALSEISLNDILYFNQPRPLRDGNKAKTSQKKRDANIKLDETYLDNSRERSLDDSESASLPAFSTDYSEMFMASMIEREADSWDLHLTTFLMCHSLIKPDKSGRSAFKIRDDKETLLSWSRAIVAFKDVRYLPSGAREATPRYFCKIKASDSSTSYTVQGEFMPNRMTPDNDANNRLDIMRCKMTDAQQSHMDLARSAHEVIVEIFREELSLIKFSVPWSTRIQSRYLDHPNDTAPKGDRSEFKGDSGSDNPKGSSKNPWASTFDPWMGFNKSTPGEWKREKLFMCVPGMDSPLSRKSLPLYLEFLQHHLLMGASHIFLSAPFAWGGSIMTNIQRTLRSFIEDGSVSITSHADDGVDYLYSTRGMSFGRDNLKLFQVNFCTYFSKGVADHVAIWDFDEFFIPKGTNRNMLDVIDSAYALNPLEPAISSAYQTSSTAKADWKGGRGWADHAGHPLCHLQLLSEVVASKDANSNIDMDHLWVGERFAHSTEPKGSSQDEMYAHRKSIIPTKSIFQVGLQISGACRLDYPWNGCDKNSTGFCYTEEKVEVGQHFSDHHSFNQIVRKHNVKEIDSASEGVLYRTMFHSTHVIASNGTDLSMKNDYAVKFFPQTLEALRKRRLDVLIETPGIAIKSDSVADSWVEYDLIYHSRGTLGTLFPASGNILPSLS